MVVRPASMGQHLALQQREDHGAVTPVERHAVDQAIGAWSERLERFRGISLHNE